MQTALLMATLHPLGQDDQTEKHDFFGHVTPLASLTALHDADAIVNSTIMFPMSR